MAACVLALAYLFGAAQAYSLDLPDKAFRLYENLRDAVYDSEPSLDTVRRLYQNAADGVRQAGTDTTSQEYWLSRVEYMAGRAYQNAEIKESAAGHYDSALARIDEALSAGDFSEGYRMKSEIISQMCLVKTVGFILANGLKVNEYAEKALKLNPDNGKAILILASAKVYPPPIYGGNPRKGVDLMLKAQPKPDMEKDDMFNVYSGLGIAYGKLKEKAKALFWMENALELYPHNKYVNDEYKKLK